MPTRYAVGSGLWSNASTVWSDSDGGAPGAFVPVDGDTVVISATKEVQVDVNQSAWTGLLGMTVRGGATPGMVYWKNGTTGTLKFRTGANVVGTTSANRGRILANADGVWDTTTVLTYATKAVIMLEGTAKLDCTNLDVRMRSDNPALPSVRCYGNKYDFNGATAVDPVNNTIDLGVPPPIAGTIVMVYSAAGTLPTGLEAERLYYVRAIVGNTCKLATQNADAQIVDITAVGSGACTLYTGFAAGSATVNVLDDVTGDKWTAGDTVVLANLGPQNYDQQHNIMVDTINAGTLVLSANVDSTQNPGARVFLSTRNCSVLHSATASVQIIIDLGVNCIFGEIRETVGTGTTFNSQGINNGVGHSAAIITGCNNSIIYGSNCSAIIITGCNNGIIYGSGHSAIIIAGCNNGIIYGSGCSAIIIAGCTYGIYITSGSSAITVIGCTFAILYGQNCTVDTIIGCSTGISTGPGHSGNTITACLYGISSCSNCTVITIIGCSYGINSSSGNRVKNLSGNTKDITTVYKVYASGGVIPAVPINNSLNADGDIGRIFSEDHAGVYGAQKIIQSFGDSVKVAVGIDTPPTPNQRSGGSADLIELSNLQSNLSGTGGAGYCDNKVIAWDEGQVRIYAEASVAKTYRFYIQSMFAITLASDLVLRATYHNSAVNNTWSTIDSDETITIRTDLDDWDQYIEVAVTPARTGWITFDIELRAYSAGNRVYIDPLVSITGGDAVTVALRWFNGGIALDIDPVSGGVSPTQFGLVPLGVKQGVV